MNGRCLMIQGTASSVGKSIIATALCRIFRQRGVRVCPFKSQNMALNSFVTREGGEIGRAQAVQAEAAGLEPTVHMNPILLKPESGTRSQVVVLGKVRASMSWYEYRALKSDFARVVTASLDELRASHELVIIEGAGSPAEINLRDFDLVNMFVAEHGDAPVILVGDIDRGGVFAQFVGTMELLDRAQRERVAAFLVNKFRGERDLLTPGLDYLERRFTRPVLGVVPRLEGLGIAEEDSVALDEKGPRRPVRDEDEKLDIAAIRLPRISNYDDFLPLEREAGVRLRFITSAAELDGADLVIIPGSKTTVADLSWLRRSGLGQAIIERANRGEPVLGICAGCQMLGTRIDDPDTVESGESESRGLALLALQTQFGQDKMTAQVVARVASTASFLTAGVSPGADLSGYEIHMGRILTDPGTEAPFRILSRNRQSAAAADGAQNRDGSVVGTMLHGLFDNRELRLAMLNNLRERKGLNMPAGSYPERTREQEYDRLAAEVRNNIDLALLDRIIGWSAA